MIERRRHETRLIDAEDMARTLSERVPGQEYVIQDLVRLIQRRSAKERQPHPIVSVLFLGAYDVGQIELAKALSAYLFNSGGPVIDYDCFLLSSSFYQSTLIGVQPGDVGYEQGGLLTRHLIENPKRVLFLKNIDCANCSLINLLVQILDEGQLIETTGKVADFSQSVLILTNREGEEEIERLSGEILDSSKRIDIIKSRLSSSGKIDPKIVWRLDGFYVFRPLSDEAMVKVIIQKFCATAREFNLELVSVDPAVVREVFRRCNERRMFSAIQCVTEIMLVEYFRASGKSGVSGERVCIGMDRDGMLSVSPVQ